MSSYPFDISVDRVPKMHLGATTLRAGAIGLGCMGLTGVYNIENRDDKRSEAAVNRALDLGMSYLDTADSFGPFGNEKFLGRILEWRRTDAVATTKVGVTGRADGTYHHNARPEHIRQAVDDSLRRLRCDYLDVYLLQAIDPAVPAEESWGAMAELVGAGKVRTLGVRTDDVRVLARLQRVFPVTVVTAELSYWEQANLPMVAWSAERGIAFVASSPLGRGFLTGGISPTRTFRWTDLRSKLPKFKPEALRREAAVLEPLRAVARAHGVRPGQVALAWLIHQGTNVIPVPGSTDPMHVAMNAGAAHLSLTPEDLALLTDEAPDAAKRQRAQEWRIQEAEQEIQVGRDDTDPQDQPRDYRRQPARRPEGSGSTPARPVPAWLEAARAESRPRATDPVPAEAVRVDVRGPQGAPADEAGYRGRSRAQAEAAWAADVRESPARHRSAAPYSGSPAGAEPDVVLPRTPSSPGAAGGRAPADDTDDGDLDALIRATSQWSYDRRG